jgi:hypothetical protein
LPFLLTPDEFEDGGNGGLGFFLSFPFLFANGRETRAGERLVQCPPCLPLWISSEPLAAFYSTVTIRLGLHVDAEYLAKVSVPKFGWAR